MEYKYLKPTTYTTITGDMIMELGLKGNELITYAIIHGFCQDGSTEFRGSITYLQEFTGLSRQGVINTINSLIEKGYIEKVTNTIGTLTYNSYKTLQVVKKFDYVVKNVDHNKDNISINKKTIEEREAEFAQDIRRFTQYPQAMLDSFIRYWTEPNKSKTKMRFEMEKTWDASRRLTTWFNNNKTKYGTLFTPVQPTTPQAPSTPKWKQMGFPSEEEYNKFHNR